MQRVIALLGATAAAAVVAAGCGGSSGGGGEGGATPPPQPVSKQELRTMLEQADREIGQSFQKVEEAARRDDPDQLRQALKGAAQTERRQIQRLEPIRPPQEAEQPLSRLLRGARGQAQRIEQLAQQENLTGKALEKQLMTPDQADKQVEQALEQLEKRGFAPPQER